jgi:hypothetical protein
MHHREMLLGHAPPIECRHNCRIAPRIMRCGPQLSLVPPADQMPLHVERVVNGLGNDKPEFENPPTDRLLANRQSAPSQEILDVPVAQDESEVEPDSVLDDSSGGNRWWARKWASRPELLSHTPAHLSVNVSNVDWKALEGTSKNRRFPSPCKSDSRFSRSERGRLAWDSLASSI